MNLQRRYALIPAFPCEVWNNPTGVMSTIQCLYFDGVFVHADVIAIFPPSDLLCIACIKTKSLAAATPLLYTYVLLPGSFTPVQEIVRLTHSTKMYKCWCWCIPPLWFVRHKLDCSEYLTVLLLCNLHGGLV